MYDFYYLCMIIELNDRWEWVIDVLMRNKIYE